MYEVFDVANHPVCRYGLYDWRSGLINDLAVFSLTLIGLGIIVFLISLSFRKTVLDYNAKAALDEENFEQKVIQEEKEKENEQSR